MKFYVSQETSLEVGEIVTGQISGATGPIFKIFDRTGIEVLAGAADKIPLSADQVYTLVLSNNNGNSFQAGEPLIAPSITLANNTNNTSISVTIAKDSGSLTDLKVIGAGSFYDSAAMTIESPQLPGGTTATGTLGISGGKLFNAEVSISGSGYTSAPSIVIAGTGSGNAGAAVEATVDIDTPAVRMGVATNLVTDVAGSVPTEFDFDYPVYLQNDTEYAFVVETDSTDYEVWASEVGEPAGSGTVTVQPGLGSVYRSQNVDSWTENLKEDIKFQLNRAEFDISRTASLMLTNDNIGYETMDANSIRTSAEASSSATLKRFRGNNRYIEVTHRDHGFEDSGKSFAFFKNLNVIGGISAASLNTTLFTVENSGIDTFNIFSVTNASSSDIGGGSNGLISLNKKFEKLYADIGYLSFPQTKIDSSVKTTNIVPVDSGPINYSSYSQSSYEKTFIKQEHYFINQKVLASRINALRNDISNSLVYKLDLSSTTSTLSPVIDLRTSSVKTISNRIENPTGAENRYGRRNQVIKLYPIVRFGITGHSGATISVGQSIQSKTNTDTSEIANLLGGTGKVLAWDDTTNKVTVQVTNEGQFKASEFLTFGADTALNGDTVSIDNSGSVPITPSFTVGSTVSGYNVVQDTQLDTSDDLYLDKISGVVVEWDTKTQELVLFNNKQPIDNDFTSKATDGSNFTRKKDPVDQQNDIFRVSDNIQYVGQLSGTENWWKIKTASLQNLSLIHI